MPANPENNPVSNLETNGRRVRHCRRSIGLMTVRTDQEAEKALKYVKETLTGTTPGDVPSVSMIIRRSLQVYRRHLSAAVGRPSGVQTEYEAIREGTIMPRLRKHLESCQPPLS